MYWYRCTFDTWRDFSVLFSGSSISTNEVNSLCMSVCVCLCAIEHLTFVMSYWWGSNFPSNDFLQVRYQQFSHSLGNIQWIIKFQQKACITICIEKGCCMCSFFVVEYGCHVNVVVCNSLLWGRCGGQPVKHWQTSRSCHCYLKMSVHLIYKLY